jgi:hypothetical protein
VLWRANVFDMLTKLVLMTVLLMIAVILTCMIVVFVSDSDVSHASSL